MGFRLSPTFAQGYLEHTKTELRTDFNVRDDRGRLQRLGGTPAMHQLELPMSTSEFDEAQNFVI